MKKFTGKRFLKTVSMLMAVAMLAGCGGAASSGDSAASTTGSTPGQDGDYPVLRMNYCIIYGNADEKKVEDALNKILREKAHAEVDLVGIEFANWTTQLNLMLTGGDDALDIFTSFWYSPLSSLKANGQVAELDDLLATQAPEVKAYYDNYPQVLDCARIDGKLYGIPSITAWSSPNIYVVKKADSDAAGIDWSKIHTLDDTTQAMLKMKEKNPSAYYIPGSTETYWVPKGIDYLGDTNYLGVLTDPTNSTKVENYYESDYFLDLLKNVKIWKDNDLISPDPLSNSNPTLLSLQYGIANGIPGYSWSVDDFCYEANATQQYGSDLVGSEIGDRLLTSGNVTTYMWHISSFCKQPEAAMRVLNVLFTDPEAANLLANGIEGLNYEMNDQGQMTYPEGKDITTAGWNTQSGLYFPNSTLCPAWDYQPTDIYDQMNQTNKDAKVSLALGFSFDSSSVSDQVTACANVISQYYMPLMYAEVNIDEVLPQFQQALHDAGIDQIIAEKQKQLDAWLAAKGE